MNTLQIVSIALSMICVVITTVLAWVAIAKAQKVQVTFAGTPVDKKEFDKEVQENKEEHDRIFAKLGGVERGLEGRLNAKLDRIDLKIDAITCKMDIDKTEILKIGEERASATHARINVLVGEVGELRGRITQTHQ